MKTIYQLFFILTISSVLLYSCGEDPGCTDSAACNYDPTAVDDDGSCEYLSCAGCMDSTACNYDSEATEDDGSCQVPLDNPIEITFVEDYVTGSVEEDLIANIHVRNASCEENTLLVRRFFSDQICDDDPSTPDIDESGPSVFFCFNGICFTASTITSPNPLTLSSFEEDDYFKGYLRSYCPGVFEVTYRFYLENDPTQFTETVITYEVN